MTSKAKKSWRIVHSESSPGWGGQERRIMAELTGFRRRGSQVWLLAPPQSQILQRAAATQLDVKALSMAKWRFPLSVLEAARWLRRVRAEVLNTHSSRDGWLAGLAGRLAGVPLIIRTRHFDVPIPNRWLSRQVYLFLADHLLTTSPKITAHFQEFFQLPPERITTLPTGIDVERFAPSGPKADLPAPPEQRQWPRLGIVAILRRAKGHAILLEAVNQLRNSGFQVRCFIVGDGPQQKSLERMVRDLGLSRQVVFTGYREDMAEVLRALDLLVIPSLHEGVPQIALQALACQVPIIASNVGGIPVVVQAGRTGRLVPPGDPGALAKAIREVFANPEATRAMYVEGRRLVEANYSLPTMLDRLEELYLQRLGSRAG
jgi:glycosyltransferase involved in cell wall biosynthesis